MPHSHAPSEVRPELDADDARIVDEAGAAVEVDRARDARGIRAVAAVQGGVVLVVLPRIAQTDAALEEALARELFGLIEEEEHLLRYGPVRIEIQLRAVREGDAIAQRCVADPLCAWGSGLPSIEYATCGVSGSSIVQSLLPS